MSGLLKSNRKPDYCKELLFSLMLNLKKFLSGIDLPDS